MGPARDGVVTNGDEPSTFATPALVRGNSAVRVLVLDGDTRQSLPIMRALSALGHDVSVACEQRVSMGWMSRFPRRRFLVPPAATEPDRFRDALLDVLRRDPHDVTIPLFDSCAQVLSRYKPEFEQYTHVPIVGYDVFVLARDKANTMRLCHTHGIPCPRTWFPDEQPIEEIGREATWPVLVKPRIGHGAIGISRVATPEDLGPVYDRTVLAYGPSIVQELIPQNGIQTKAELFRDRDGALKAAVVFDKPRYFPVTGGTSSLNRTVHRPDIVETGRRLLDAMGWHGYADLDLIDDPRDGVAKVMEVNPRVTGSVKIAFAAGVDFADLLVRQALGQPLPTYDGYRVGVYMRYIPLDLLWFIYSPDRFRARPSWFRFWGHDVCEQVFTFDDPGPFLALTLSGARRLMSKQVRAAKLKRLPG